MEEKKEIKIVGGENHMETGKIKFLAQKAKGFQF